QVDRDIKEDRRGQSGRGKLCEAGARILAYAHAPVNDRAEGADQDHAADEAPFLGHRREDEVRVTLRQILQVTLAAVEEALAPDPARSDCDLRLRDVIA